MERYEIKLFKWLGGQTADGGIDHTSRNMVSFDVLSVDVARLIGWEQILIRLDRQ